MKAMKVMLYSLLATGLFFSTANAEMMGKGKGMMCDKMGKSGKMGMMHGMGMKGDDMMHGPLMKKGLHFYFKNKEALGLTDAQLDKLHDMKITFKKSYIMDKAKLKVAKLELEELLDADAVNMKSVEKKVKEIAGLKEMLLLAKVTTRVESQNVLTAEQRKKAKGLRHEKSDACPMMKGKMSGGSDEMSMEGLELEAAGHEGHH